MNTKREWIYSGWGCQYGHPGFVWPLPFACISSAKMGQKAL